MEGRGVRNPGAQCLGQEGRRSYGNYKRLSKEAQERLAVEGTREENAGGFACLREVSAGGKGWDWEVRRS